MRRADELIAEAVDEAMQPVVEDMAEGVILAVMEERELATDDPAVLAEAIYKCARIATGLWHDVRDRASALAHGRCARDDLAVAFACAERAAEVSGLLVDQLAVQLAEG